MMQAAPDTASLAPKPATPSTPLTLPERLKQHTARDHAEVEACVDLMGIDSLGRYLSVLQAFHGFWPGMEARIQVVLPPALQQEWMSRWRAARLGPDLRLLGFSADAVAALPACDTWPEISSPAAALGALYVLEGSSLGARHISRHLADRLGLSADCGAGFFAGHGAQTGALWLRFKDVLQEQLTTPTEQAMAVNAAGQTFSCLNHWFQHSLGHG